MEHQHATVCYECGGSVVPVAKPGRVAQYRGRRGFVIPSELEILTCLSCGGQLETADVATLLDEAFEQQFQARFPFADMNAQFGRPAGVIRVQGSVPEPRFDDKPTVARVAPTQMPIEFVAA